jgi:hypothetical protein
MGRWLLALLSIMLVSAMLLVAACGGGNDDDEDDGGDGDGDGAPTATETADNGDEATPDSDDGGGDEDDAASNLRALAEDYEDFRGVIKYETTGFDGAFSSMTIYKGENASRVDYEGEDGTGTIITTSDAFYLCGEGACIKYPTGDASLDPTAALTGFLSASSISEQYSDIPDGIDVEESDEEIAGVNATCYTYSGDIDETESGDETGAICVSESGLLLRLEFSGAGGGAFEATEASDDVSDADFEPPFPVTELPDFGQ